jgi:hypothetical protein
MNALPESDRCIRGLRVWVGYKQTGVSFVRPERMFGKSTLRPAALFAFARKTLLSFSHAPLEALTGLFAAAVANHLPGCPELDDAIHHAGAAIAKAEGAE